MNRLARYLMPFAVAAMLGGCGVKESFQEAGGAIDRFHAALDAGNGEGLWNAADPQLRAATGRDQFARLLDAVHRKLGKVRASKQIGWNANATTGGTYLTVTTQTTFERGTGTEQFVFHKQDEKLTLAGYHIESQDMMLN